MFPTNQPIEIITYSLREVPAGSSGYYRTIARFADEVLAEEEKRAGSLLDAYQSAQDSNSTPAEVTRPEAALELLTLGVLWQTYSGVAQSLSPAPRRILKQLVRLREGSRLLKPGVDLLRGLVGACFLPRGNTPPPEPTLEHLARLLDWLAATGELQQELKRLRRWQSFLAGESPEQATTAFTTAIDLATWFGHRSLAVLGRYTANVEPFLARTRRRYRWREDAFLCGRRRVEYHLGMVATELLNRVHREAFLATPVRIVLLPPCMKAQSDDKCKARSSHQGSVCAHCTPSCRVNRLTQLGDRYGFRVVLLPDELRALAGAGGSNRSVGFVGISCVLTNASGGWETRALGISAQGVLLDYCGCSYHWHKQGISTNLDEEQILAVLGVDARPD